MPKTSTAVTIVASTAAYTGSGTVDCSARDGGIVTLRITNAASAPTTQVEAKVFVSHASSTLPSAAAEGTGASDWKQVYIFGGGTTNNASTRGVYRFGPEVKYLQVRFENGAGGSTPTIESFATTYAY